MGKSPVVRSTENKGSADKAGRRKTESQGEKGTEDREDASEKQGQVHITRVDATGEGLFVVVCLCGWTSKQYLRKQALSVGFIHRMANR